MQFQFELVSPEKLLKSEAVTMVTVPGGEGVFGVLAGHAPMITTVRPGVIEVYANDDKTVSERIFVAGGFAEVNGERCTVLAESATPVADINRLEVESQIKALHDGWNAAAEGERAALEKQLAAARAKLQAIPHN